MIDPTILDELSSGTPSTPSTIGPTRKRGRSTLDTIPVRRTRSGENFRSIEGVIEALHVSAESRRGARA